MKRILITGASGFIAPNLITECLRKKYNVVGVDLLDKDETFPIKNTEFNIFSDYMVCLGIAKLVFFPNKDEIKGFVEKKLGFFEKFYSMFLK